MHSPKSSPTATAIRRDLPGNPHIALKADLDLYSGGLTGRSGIFSAGRRNQTIKGAFGFLESDGSTPALIKHAALMLVYSTATALSISSSTTTTAGPIKKEKVDRHEVEYIESSSGTSTSALSSSPEVEEIIQLYKGPIGIGAAPPRMTSSVSVF